MTTQLTGYPQQSPFIYCFYLANQCEKKSKTTKARQINIQVSAFVCIG